MAEHFLLSKQHMTSPLSIDILLVEDHHDIASNIMLYLTQYGHRVDIMYSANGALSLLEEQKFDVLILDVMLPGMNGFSLANTIRQRYNQNTPIIFLTARDTLEDKQEGFDSGADDYLTKPFELKELLMRVEALYRRATGQYQQHLQIGQWRIDIQSQEIHLQDKKITTTHTGFKIFHSLVLEHPGILTKRNLEKKLWGDSPPDSDALRSHVFSLRKAITHVTEETVIETVHGVGYRLIGKTTEEN